MLVDDNAVLLRLLVHVIEAEDDLEVCGTASGGAAGALRTVQLRPDVVLMDVVMPQVDGFAAIETIRGYGVTSPVVLMSVDESEDLAHRAALVGAAGYVRKTDGVGAVVDAVHRALARAAR